MRSQLGGLIMFCVFVVVNMSGRILINAKQMSLVTAETAAVTEDASIHSKHLPTARLPGLRHRQGYNFNSFHRSILANQRSSHRREKRGSEYGDEGMQVSPVLTLKVTDAFNRPLTGSGGPTELRVGDYVRFIINLTRDGIYHSLEVRTCTMSTSFIMPDPKAETRVLLLKGCPIQDEATADSWYWTSEMSTNATFVSNTQLVPIFRLSSSEYIYLHCAMKMCFVGYDPCQQPTRSYCAAMQSMRKKREEFLPTRKRRSESADGITHVNQTLALRVIDPRVSPKPYNPTEVGTSGYITLVVLCALIGFLVIVLIIILVVVLVRRRPKNTRMSQPQQFAQQRVTPTPAKRKCLTCL